MLITGIRAVSLHHLNAPEHLVSHQWASMLRLFSRGRSRALQTRPILGVENTDLEGRVLAHERILQVLIAHMAEAEPKFLDRLQQVFTKPTHWALASRTTPVRPHTQSTLSSRWCA